MRDFVNRLMPRYEMDGGAAAGGSVDSGSGGQGAPDTGAAAPAQPAVQQQPMVNPLLTKSIFTDHAPLVPAQPQPEVPKLNFAGREVPVIDPVIQDIHKDYTELNRTYQQTNQSLKALQDQNAQMQMMIQQYQQMAQMMNQPNVQAQQQAPAQQAPDPEALKEQFLEKFYENPLDAIGEYVKQMMDKEITPVIQPIQQERQNQQQLQELTQKYPDFRDMIPAMQDVIRQMPQLEQLGAEAVYQAAKAFTPAQQAAPVQSSPESLLADPNFVSQILQNEQITQQVVNQYLQTRQQTNNAVPNVMANQPGGSIPQTPQEKPKSLRDGTKLLQNFLGINR